MQSQKVGQVAQSVNYLPRVCVSACECLCVCMLACMHTHTHMHIRRPEIALGVFLHCFSVFEKGSLVDSTRVILSLFSP